MSALALGGPHTHHDDLRSIQRRREAPIAAPLPARLGYGRGLVQRERLPERAGGRGGGAQAPVRPTVQQRASPHPCVLTSARRDGLWGQHPDAYTTVTLDTCTYSTKVWQLVARCLANPLTPAAARGLVRPQMGTRRRPL